MSKVVQNERSVVTVSRAHRDFEELLSIGRYAQRRAVHGEVLAAALLARVEEDGWSRCYSGVEHAVKRSGASWVAGDVDAANWGGGKDVTVANFAVARTRLVGVLRGEKESIGRWSCSYRERRRCGASTLAGDTGKQAAAWPLAHALGTARPPAALAVHSPLCEHCSRVYLHLSPFFITRHF